MAHKINLKENSKNHRLKYFPDWKDLGGDGSQLVILKEHWTAVVRSTLCSEN